MTVLDQLQKVVQEGLAIEHLQVEDESHQHNVPAGAQSHFKMVIVSDDFEGKRKVARHQQVYGLVGDLMGNPIHALALHIYTVAEWQQRQGAPDSPDCLGGSKAEG